MARSPVTEVLERYHALSEEQQKVFLDIVDPQVEPEQPAKKPRKKRTAKSLKAQSLENVIKSSHEARADSNGGADIEPEDFGPRCGVCGHGEQYQDHFEPSPNYHPFDSPVVSAEKKSRRKGAAANITQNSEIEKGAAISAGGGD